MRALYVHLLSTIKRVTERRTLALCHLMLDLLYENGLLFVPSY